MPKIPPLAQQLLFYLPFVKVHHIRINKTMPLKKFTVVLIDIQNDLFWYQIEDFK
jgi:hypothetical protein